MKVNRSYLHTSPAIHIRKPPAAEWLQVRFLALRAGYLCVDDGSGPIWIPFEVEYIHPDDWSQFQEKGNQTI